MTLFTDYPFTFLGDDPNRRAPIRRVKLLKFDGNKYATIRVEGYITEIKAGYLYHDRKRRNQRHVKQLRFTIVEHFENKETP